MCSLTTIIRFIIAIFNLILGLAFLGLGIVGALLLTNKAFILTFTRSLSERFLKGMTKEQANEVASFIAKYDVQAPALFITIGFTIACVCILGFIATCCSCNKLMQMYAVLLTIAVIGEAVAVGVIFGVSSIYTTAIFKGLENLLTAYNPNSPEGKGPAELWNAIMSFGNTTCCGMNGAQDFLNTPMKGTCPIYCCKGGKTCTYKEAMSLVPPVKGCKERIEKYAKKYMRKALIILLIFLAAQLILLALTYAALTHKTATPI